MPSTKSAVFWPHLISLQCVEMPVANYNASELTRVRRAMALYAFQSQNVIAVNAGTSVRPEQTSSGTLDVVVARNQGGCYCATAYTYDGKNGCGCNITK